MWTAFCLSPRTSHHPEYHHKGTGKTVRQKIRGIFQGKEIRLLFRNNCKIFRKKITACGLYKEKTQLQQARWSCLKFRIYCNFHSSFVTGVYSRTAIAISALREVSPLKSVTSLLMDLKIPWTLFSAEHFPTQRQRVYAPRLPDIAQVLRRNRRR